MSDIYLDAAATAKYNKVDDEIISVMTLAMKKYWKNPSSLYATEVKNEISKCRKNIADFIGAKADEIYFTSGASESNNWVIRGFADNMWNRYKTPIIITTPIEHKSIIKAICNPCLDAFCYYCEVDKYGMVNLNSLEELLKHREEDSVLVSIGFANNEIGTIQPIKAISNIVHKYNGILHVDATQVLPHYPIDVEELGIDLMSASGHKISPVLRGIGFLYKKDGIEISPLIHGAQESELRGGTENTYGIIGLSYALNCIDFNARFKEAKHMIYFIDLLISKFGCQLNGSSEYRLHNIINVTFPQNITGESLLYTLEMSNIYVSTGSACNSYTNVPSYVLKEIGLTDEEVMRTVRFSLPSDITYKEIDKVVEEIGKAIKLISL